MNEINESDLLSALEAILIASGEPVSAESVGKVLGIDKNTTNRAFEKLRNEYTEHAERLERTEQTEQVLERHCTTRKPGWELVNIEGEGWQLFSKRKYAHVVESFLKDARVLKLSFASLEVLAIIAYKQPVTRGYINSVRGINSDSLVRNLLLRGLITESDEISETGASKYVTTKYFLEKLGVERFDELYPIAPYLPDSENILQIAEETDKIVDN
jgi:segregation and condensation protein B